MTALNKAIDLKKINQWLINRRPSTHAYVLIARTSLFYVELRRDLKEEYNGVIKHSSRDVFGRKCSLLIDENKETVIFDPGAQAEDIKRAN